MQHLWGSVLTGDSKTEAGPQTPGITMVLRILTVEAIMFRGIFHVVVSNPYVSCSFSRASFQGTSFWAQYLSGHHLHFLYSVHPWRCCSDGLWWG